MRKTFQAAKKALKDVFQTASDEVSSDLKQINKEIVHPAVRLGKNRVVCTIAGAKIGFATGAIVGPIGLLHGTLAGAFIGAVGGPTAMAQLEKLVKVPAGDNTDTANENAPETVDRVAEASPEDKNAACETRPAGQKADPGPKP
jgi:hypothetical protein